MKDPLEGRDIIIPKGVQYGIYCDSCKDWCFGFHIDQGDDPPLDEPPKCERCGDKVHWELRGYSDGQVIRKGKK